MEPTCGLVSIILPAYYASDSIQNQVPGLIDFFHSKKINFEIIIVDDGSDDNGATKNVSEKLHCTYLQNEKNIGKGSAVRKGILNARGEFIFYTDADIPFEYESIEKFLYYLDFKEFDIVIGDRTLPKSLYFEEVSFLRKLTSRIFTFIVGRFITSGYNDTQCGLKGLRASIAKDVFNVSQINSFAFDVELLYIALKRNYNVKKLPVILRIRDNKSSVKVFRDSFIMLVDIFRIKYFQLKGTYKINEPTV